MPADAFYEWRTSGGPKQPFAFARVDGQPTVFAGLWEAFRWPSGEVTRTFCIITTIANTLMAPIHDRMPVVLEPTDWPLWLGDAEGDPATVLHPPADGVLHAWPISTRVNSPRNNEASLLDPVDGESISV